MATLFTRVRKSVTPTRKSGSFKLGYYNSAITVGGVPTGAWSPAEVNPRYFNYQSPYDVAKYCADNLHPGPPFREGGPFRLLRLEYTTPYFGVFGKGVYVRADRLQRYVGGFAPPGNSYFGGTAISDYGALFAPNSPMFSDLSPWSSEAWQKCKPKLEKASLGVAIAEIRDLPRMLKTSAKEFADAWRLTQRAAGFTGDARKVMMTPQRAADSFLNQQFGWVPFLSDVRKFNDVLQNSRRYIDQISDQNGKWVKHHAVLVGVKNEHDSLRDPNSKSQGPDESAVFYTSDTVEFILNSGTGQVLDPILGTHWSQYFSVEPTWEVIERTERLVTAVGSFQYYRPEFDRSLAEFNSAWNNMIRNLTIHGVRVSPSNIYKATPWTWAVDWISDVGEHVAYLDDIILDSLVAKYFYLMQHKVITRTFRQILPFYSGAVVLQFNRVIETKQREEAGSPYDFNLSWEDLTPRQLLIAAALGISRKRPAGG